jgi:hypothetical protein
MIDCTCILAPPCLPAVTTSRTSGLGGCLDRHPTGGGLAGPSFPSCFFFALALTHLHFLCKPRKIAVDWASKCCQHLPPLISGVVHTDCSAHAQHMQRPRTPARRVVLPALLPLARPTLNCHAVVHHWNGIFASNLAGGLTACLRCFCLLGSYCPLRICRVCACHQHLLLHAVGICLMPCVAAPWHSRHAGPCRRRCPKRPSATHLPGSPHLRAHTWVPIYCGANSNNPACFGPLAPLLGSV